MRTLPFTTFGYRYARPPLDFFPLFSRLYRRRQPPYAFMPARRSTVGRRLPIINAAILRRYLLSARLPILLPLPLRHALRFTCRLLLGRYFILPATIYDEASAMKLIEHQKGR